MKIKCDVCKTEYTLTDLPSGQVRCAVCGNTWTPPRANRRSGLMVFVASLCALLSATVFAVAVIVTSRRDDPNKRPLVATITDVVTITDTETPQIRVKGTVTNRSDDIYGLPDLVIVLYDASGTPVARQKFMPSATLLDAGQSVEFAHTITNAAPGVKRVSVELLETDNGGKK